MCWPFEGDPPPPILYHLLLQGMLMNPVKAWHSLVTATGPQNGALKTERKDGDHVDQ